MQKLSFIIFLFSNLILAQSPHGANFNIECGTCHTTESWKIDFSKLKFNHSQTGFELKGQHSITNCNSCHKSLTFTNTPKDCASCHTDIHEGTTDLICQNCHNSNSWIINNQVEIHLNSRFPLVGAHNNSDCSLCHISNSKLKFEPLNVECITCHKKDYLATSSPNHIDANFSLNCEECHSHNSFIWNFTNINHSFFPLTNGHNIPNCFDCHNTESYSGLSTDCYSCHKQEYDETSNPNHQALEFGTDCESCHKPTTWQEATFDHDNKFFPIYSGEHKGEWNQCSDCHNVTSNYQIFECINCHEHEKTKMDKEHSKVSGYIYQSSECYACHPTGKKEGAFNHAISNFPLTGAHVNTNCNQCHINSYSGTSTQCNDCHLNDFNSSVNPNHSSLALPTNCEQCHTTNPDWYPALFPNHDQYYQLVGAHQNIKNDCTSCHKNNYNNTPNLCYDCHQNDFNTTQNPPHQSTGFSIDCETCHSQVAWQPATFDHDNQFFPIYSGEHKGEWNQCSDCHNVTSNYQIFECINCHEHEKTKMDSKHSGVKDYVYSSQNCYSCHPDGKEGNLLKTINSPYARV